MRARYLWPFILIVLFIFALVKGGVYPLDFRFRHKHNEAPAVVEELRDAAGAVLKK